MVVVASDWRVVVDVAVVGVDAVAIGAPCDD